MFNKIKKSLTDAGGNLIDQAGVITDSIKEQANNLSENAKEKANAVIQTWVGNLPLLESYGLKNIYFGITMSLSPSLELEMKGNREDFSVETLEKILAENKGNSTVTIIFSAIKNAVKMYESAGIEKHSNMYVKIAVRLSPEVKVAFGTPIVY